MWHGQRPSPPRLAQYELAHIKRDSREHVSITRHMPCDSLRQPPRIAPQFTLTPIPRLRGLLVTLLVKPSSSFHVSPDASIRTEESLRPVMVSASGKRNDVGTQSTRVRSCAGRSKHRTGARARAAMRRHATSNPRTGKITVSASPSNLEPSANLRVPSPAVLALPFGVPP